MASQAQMRVARATLTTGSVSGQLMALTVPMVWGIVAMMAFNVTDTWFVAQLGQRQLAAISFTFPVVMLLISLGIGLMSGTASVLARVIGAGGQDEVKRLATDALLLASVVSLLCTVAGLVTIDPLFSALGADESVLPLIRGYMRVWYSGYLFVLVPMVAFGALRAVGDSGAQGRIMATGSLLNLILDPLLIFGMAGFPRLELEGAAAATVAARGLTLLASFWVLQRKHGLLSFALPSKRQLFASGKRIAHVGLPAAGTNMIVPAATGMVVAIIADFGQEAVGGHGAATRVEQVSLVFFYAMSAIIGPFVGQNLGACRPQRIIQAMRASAAICLGLGIVLAIVLALAAPSLMSLFGSEKAVREVGILYLRLLPISNGAYGLVMVVLAAFNGVGRPMPAVGISLLRMLVLYVPLAFLGGRVAGITGVFVGAALANLVAGALAYFWFMRTCKECPPTTL